MLSAWSIWAHLHNDHPWFWMMESYSKEETEAQGSLSNFPTATASVSDVHWLLLCTAKHSSEGQHFFDPRELRALVSLVHLSSQSACVMAGKKEEMWGMKRLNTAEERLKAKLRRSPLCAWVTRVVKKKKIPMVHVWRATWPRWMPGVFSAKAIWSLYLRSFTWVYPLFTWSARQTKGHGKIVNTFTFSECHQSTATAICFFNWQCS